MIVISLVVVFTRVLVQVAEINAGIERFLESETACLVADGIVDTSALKRENIAHDELMTALREAGVENLGQVRRTYLEPSGNVSTFLFPPRLSSSPATANDVPPSATSLTAVSTT